MMQMPIPQPDKASIAFYEHLNEDKFQSTKCSACDRIHWPPRNRCPGCMTDQLEWTDLPREGKLIAFTTQHRSYRFKAPEVIGMAEIEGVKGDPVRFMCAVKGSFDELSIGQDVTVGTVQTFDGFTVIQVEPKG